MWHPTRTGRACNLSVFKTRESRPTSRAKWRVDEIDEAKKRQTYEQRIAKTFRMQNMPIYCFTVKFASEDIDQNVFILLWLV
jgi:hypothetical protein